MSQGSLDFPSMLATVITKAFGATAKSGAQIPPVLTFTMQNGNATAVDQTLTRTYGGGTETIKLTITHTPK